MSSFLQSILSCCGSRDKEIGEDNERTPLLNPDILPEAPARPVGRTTEEQVAEQEALRRILHNASERFVDIESPTPFSRPSGLSPYSSRSVSPDPADSPTLHPRSQRHRASSASSHTRNSLWRAAENGGDGVKVVSLGAGFEPRENGNGRGRGKGMRPASSHSLRTLGKGTSRSTLQPSPLRPMSSTGETSRRPSSTLTSDGEGDGSRFSTMASYKTASEGGDSEQGTFKARNGNGNGARAALKDVWRRDEGSSAGYEEVEESREDTVKRIQQSEELAGAIKRLEDSMVDFKLVNVGPIVEELSERYEGES